MKRHITEVGAFMSKNRFRLMMLLTVTITFLSSCYNDKEELLYPGSNNPVNCTTVPAKFAADVFPIINSRCAIPGCHDATASGGVIFQNYTQISAKKDRINTRALVDKTMPPTGPLLPDEINKIKCWLEAGALNN